MGRRKSIAFTIVSTLRCLIQANRLALHTGHLGIQVRCSDHRLLVLFFTIFGALCLRQSRRLSDQSVRIHHLYRMEHL